LGQKSKIKFKSQKQNKTKHYFGSPIVEDYIGKKNALLLQIYTNQLLTTI
jgi:hypothetical protein